jgi:hypothetical protein
VMDAALMASLVFTAFTSSVMGPCHCHCHLLWRSLPTICRLPDHCTECGKGHVVVVVRLDLGIGLRGDVQGTENDLLCRNIPVNAPL